jgi:hypothetical protein
MQAIAWYALDCVRLVSDILGMTQDVTVRRRTSYLRETGQYKPRRFHPGTRDRFLRSRRRAYLSRISGQPTSAQAAIVASVAQLEWNALAAEHENTLQSLREAREHRRLLLRVLADFEASIPPAPAPRNEKRPPSLRDIVAEAVAAREATG